MRPLTGLLVTCSLTWFAAAAQAQYYSDNVYGSFATSGSEIQSRGMADVMLAAGQRNLMNAQALTELQEAEKKNIENDLLYTQTYFEKRKINEQNRQAEAAQRRSTPEDFARRAQAGAPKRLTSQQLDPIYGTVSWPVLLQFAKYQESREELDRLFRERAEKRGAIGGEAYLQIKDDTKKMTELLLADISKVSPTDYIAAKKFLESLAYEAGFPPS